MVTDMLDNGLRAHSYLLRGRVLANIFEIKKSSDFGEGYILNCTTQAGWLAQQLFVNFPSISEVSQCKTCNYTNEKNFTAVQIEDTDIKTSKKDTFIKTFCSTGYGRCFECFLPDTEKKKVKLTVKTTLSSLGNFYCTNSFTKLF